MIAAIAQGAEHLENAEQTLNILSEMGPIFTMFIVNFVFGVEAGVWSLIGTTLVALGASLAVLKRPPIMPFIAGRIEDSLEKKSKGALAVLAGYTATEKQSLARLTEPRPPPGNLFVRWNKARLR